MKMNKRMMALALALPLVLAACEEPNQVGTSKNNEVTFTEICIDGVVYLVRNAPWAGYMSVKLSREGTVFHCE